jgi:hypothetical protein
MNPLRRLLEAVGLKPKERKKRLPLVEGLLKRLGR